MNHNDLRRGLNIDHLVWDDFQTMIRIRAGLVYMTDTGVDMRKVSAQPYSDVRRVSTVRLRERGLVDKVKPGDHYHLNAAGDAALDAWLASRATTTPEGL
jgi:hypothetical protein